VPHEIPSSLSDYISPDDPLYDYELLKRFPAIDWLSPITITIPGYASTDFACRICIARYGFAGPKRERTEELLRALDVKDFPANWLEFERHMAEKHYSVEHFAVEP
jgi:hypothetical protein